MSEENQADFLLGAFVSSQKPLPNPAHVQELKSAYEAAAASTAKRIFFARNVATEVAVKFHEDNNPRSVVWSYHEDGDTVDLILWRDPEIHHSLLKIFGQRLLYSLRSQTSEQLGLRIVAIDDVRCKLRTRAPTKSIGKEADCSYLHEDLLVQQGEGVTGGSLVFEGAVDNESQPVLLKEHSGWHSVEQCLVVVSIKVWLKGEPGNRPAPRMIATLSEKRDGWTVFHNSVEFGAGSSCLAEGTTGFNVQVRRDVLLHNTTDSSPPDSTSWMTVDLFHVRKAIFRQIGKDPNSQYADVELQPAQVAEYLKSHVRRQCQARNPTRICSEVEAACLVKFA